jgi:hypothetical protein
VATDARAGTAPGAAVNTNRKPRLTEQRLADLHVAVDALEGEIEYLATALNGTLSDALRARFRDRHDALLRSSTWLRGMVAAVHEKRGGVP